MTFIVKLSGLITDRSPRQQRETEAGSRPGTRADEMASSTGGGNAEEIMLMTEDTTATFMRATTRNIQTPFLGNKAHHVTPLD